MTRHLIDSPQRPHSNALHQFLKIARASAPHHSSRRLIARLRPQGAQRLGAYLRIARGQQS
ncbi:MAG: hypothetical protein LAT78_09120 [Roseinatronobacter sp.]|jgi:hypothetical protein|nr:hypothetical protein [Roseinatronobacter sp.]